MNHQEEIDLGVLEELEEVDVDEFTRLDPHIHPTPTHHQVYQQRNVFPNQMTANPVIPNTAKPANIRRRKIPVKILIRGRRLWFSWLWFLKEDEQLLVETFTKRRVINGPKTYASRPFERVTKRRAVTLRSVDYLHVRNDLSGETRLETGPKLFFPDVNETIVAGFDMVPLQSNQYMRLQDSRTGAIRVERGETSVSIRPTEIVIQNRSDGINVDDNTAVVVRDLQSGQLSLITEPQIFIPQSHQEIVRSSPRIRLEDHETVVVKDRTGQYSLRTGGDAERSFFLDPYSELVSFYWSTGIHKVERSLVITRIDSRPKFMWYEFEARTQDNVELLLGITFFWQVTDVGKMIQTTDDTPGDICSHARSAIIQSVSRVNLEAFLSDFNNVIHESVAKTDDRFYEERGVKLHAVEVRSISCKDDATQKVLQEIIQEATNRLSRLQKQESENEIQIKQLNGEIESEELRRGLLEIKQKNAQAAAIMEGKSEALRVRFFMNGLGEDLSQSEKVGIFNTLRKREMLDSLGQGNAQLYFTPSDVDITIESKPGD